MRKWNNILIHPQTPIIQVIKVIDNEGLRAALVVDEDNHLLGMVTDGDIRRCLLKEVSLDAPVHTIMNRTPTTAEVTDTRDQVLSKLQSLSLYHLPIVDHEHKVVGFETLDGLLALNQKDNWVVVMAGGMGTRLHPLTVDCPKPLLKIGNKPVLEIVLENFIKHGFHRFYFAVNYKSEMIKAYFHQGQQWGVEIRYLEENQRLGTAGALSLLKEKPEKPFFVINADVVTNVDFQSLLDYHNQHQVGATMCIREHEQVVPYGVVQRDADTHHLLTIVEKPVRQFFVNAGIYILEPDILHYLTENTYCDMPDLLTTCVSHQHRVATFPIKEYWLDIGRHEDLEKAHLDYAKVF